MNGIIDFANIKPSLAWVLDHHVDRLLLALLFEKSLKPLEVVLTCHRPYW